tara:strand:- start:29331 stop:29897 length:567 start_codon:yes stop_codon:yes gene_type:complete
MVLIHEKITALLEQRRLKKRDLARALGVSPQTATDICKGRSAITLPHLRNLVSYFEVRAEFWLDDDRLTPIEIDQLARRGAAEALMRTGMLDIEDPQHLMERVRGFLQQQRDTFLSAYPDLTAAELRLLGLADPELGVVGKISGSEMGAPQTAPAVASPSGGQPAPAQETAGVQRTAGGAQDAQMEGQ